MTDDHENKILSAPFFHTIQELASYHFKTLSFAGRLALTKSVLSSKIQLC